MTFKRGAAGGAFVLASVVALTVATLPQLQAAEQVNIYSYREPGLIKPLLEAFQKKTGIKANVVYAKKGLVERAAAEGRNSPVDVLLTVEIKRLTEAERKGITHPIKSDVIDANIPARYRDPEGQLDRLVAACPPHLRVKGPREAGHHQL